MASRRKRPTPKKRRRAARWLLAGAGVALVVGGLVLWRLDVRVGEFVRDRSAAGVSVYTDSLRLRPGLDVEGLRLRPRLERLGYRETSGAPRAAGEYRFAADRVEIALRPFGDADGLRESQRVRLALQNGRIRALQRIEDGAVLDDVRLDPELLGSYAGGPLGERRFLPLSAFPQHVVAAVLAAEDARFASHPGIDPLGLLRAAWVNLRGGGVRQGGSTITQQLAKNVFLTPERSLRRKLIETVIAFLLEARLSKEEILEAYLNRVYLGRVGSIGLYGVAQGARAFFAKEPRDLDLGEAATLAGVIHSPNLDSPLRHVERSRERRNQVLGLMAENGWLAREELARLQAEPVRIDRRLGRPLEAPFFVDEVLRRFAKLGYETGLVHDVSIFTTADLEVQHDAEEALTSGLRALEGAHRRLQRGADPLEAAAVVLEADTGFVRALVGGRDFGRSQFNRVTRSRRQPGSAFKPFVYLTALDDPDDPATPSTVLRDEPLRLNVGNQSWTPTNYDGRYLGDVTVRTALEGSRNVPTVELAQRVGFTRVAETARLVGLGKMPVLPAIALGAAEVSLLDLGGAYTVFANFGAVVRPALIRGIVAADGTMLYRDRFRSSRVATAPASYVTGHLLEGVIDEGTGAGVRRLGLQRTVAGKTGTTNDAKDAWFMGYSPDVVAGVWVGFDDGTPVDLTGAQAALPIWVALMQRTLERYEDRPFAVPAGVVFAEVDRQTGLISSFSCPDAVHEAFVAGSEPRFTCDGREVGPASPSRERRPGWLQRLFRGL